MLQAEFVHINVQEILHRAMIPAALAAGHLVVNEAKKRKFSVSKKTGSGDLVTAVDLEVAKLISGILSGMYPQIPILDEELSNEDFESFKKLAFVVDPVDGTLNFVHGYSEVSVSIGLIYEGKPLIGVVYQPFLDTLYSGIVHVGAWKNGEAIRIGAEQSLNECLVATGIPYDYSLRECGFLEPVRILLNEVQELRILGSAAAALCYVASNQLSGFFEYGLSPWDLAGGLAIILGAGGCAYTIEEQGSIIFGKSIVVANCRIGTILCNKLQG